MSLQYLDLLDISSSILPGYGFFGNTESSSLKIEVGSFVDKIILYISSESDEILNIYSPRIFSIGGEMIDLLDPSVSVKLSSEYKDSSADVESKIRHNKILHTEREKFPSITISFSRRMYVDYLHVFNRPDACGVRSKNLKVSFFKGKICVLEYNNSCPKKMVGEFKNLCGHLGVILPQEKSEIYPSEIISELKYKIEKSANNGVLRLSYRQINQLIPPVISPEKITNYEISLCASAILSIIGDKNGAPTRLISHLSSVMSTGGIVDLVEDACNHIIQKKGKVSEKLIFSKHKMHYSTLVVSSERYLSAMDKIFSIFREIGLPLFLSYGTLLGAVRDKAFLEHDDDVDLLYWDGSTSRASMIENQKDVMNVLKDYGLKIYEDPKGMNFHVIVDGVSLDLFPSWIEGEDLYLLMEEMNYRSINKSICFGESASTAVLHGREYPAPSKPEEFLLERYGEGWSTPDKFYGWPWRLNK